MTDRIREIRERLKTFGERLSFTHHPWCVDYEIEEDFQYLLAALERAREALRFYANAENYIGHEALDVLDDGGTIARDALRGIE